MIKVSADSTCDLSKEILDKFDIAITPLTIVHGDKSYKDCVDINRDDVFRLTEESGILCSTSAVNIFDYTQFFEERLKNCDGIIHVCISGEMSTCFNNARNAAQEFDGKVVVIDSRNLSTGMGLVVYEAALMAQSGVSLHEAEEKLNALTGKVEASFVIDKLDYLKRGGRCSSLAAFGAQVLSLKPCIEVSDGKMKVGEKYKGSFEKCLKRYVKDRLEGRDDINYDRIFITDSGVDESVRDMVEELIREYADFKEIIRTDAGCTIACHCGPNTLGILFFRK